MEKTFVYAYDVVVVANNGLDLQNIVDTWHVAMSQNGMKIYTGRDVMEFMYVCYACNGEKI